MPTSRAAHHPDRMISGLPSATACPGSVAVCVPCLASNSTRSTRRGLVGPTPKVRPRPAGLAPWSAAMPRGVSAAPSSVPPFELLESKLLPPHGPSGTVSRGELISSLEGSRAPPARCPIRRPRLGQDDAARSMGLPVAAPVRLGIRRRKGQRSDRPAHLCRGGARPRLAARPRACSTHWRRRAPRLRGRSSRASERPWRGWMRTSSWCSTICICSTTRPASTPSRHSTRHVSEGSQMALSARGRPALPAGSAAGAGPGAGDRAGRSPHGRGRGAPSC